jgi:predicted acetyltransferase
LCRYTSFSDHCGKRHISESLNTNKPDFVIRRVDRSHDATLQNLFEHYLHDMAEWFQFDYAPDGRYAYDPAFYRDNGAEVWFAYVGEIPIAFAVVGSAQAFIDDADAKDLDEFFVVRRYRRSGVGRDFARQVWDAYSGRWVVRVFQGNVPALPFWRGAIAEYTDHAYREEVRSIRERPWSYFTFDNSGPR